MECFVYLQHRGLAVKLQLVDPWVREFQVLAERCHPQMTVNMTAGCILTGVVVSSKVEQLSSPLALSTVRTASAAGCEEEQQQEPNAKRTKIEE